MTLMPGLEDLDRAAGAPRRPAPPGGSASARARRTSSPLVDRLAEDVEDPPERHLADRDGDRLRRCPRRRRRGRGRRSSPSRRRGRGRCRGAAGPPRSASAALRRPGPGSRSRGRCRSRAARRRRPRRGRRLGSRRPCRRFRSLQAFRLLARGSRRVYPSRNRSRTVPRAGATETPPRGGFAGSPPAPGRERCPDRHTGGVVEVSDVRRDERRLVHATSLARGPRRRRGGLPAGGVGRRCGRRRRRAGVRVQERELAARAPSASPEPPPTVPATMPSPPASAASVAARAIRRASVRGREVSRAGVGDEHRLLRLLERRLADRHGERPDVGDPDGARGTGAEVRLEEHVLELRQLPVQLERRPCLGTRTTPVQIPQSRLFRR